MRSSYTRHIHWKIMDMLEGGPMTTREIVLRMVEKDIYATATYQHLATMVKDGLIVHPSRGIYALPNPITKLLNKHGAGKS